MKLKRAILSASILLWTLAHPAHLVTAQETAAATGDITKNPVDPIIIKELVGDWKNELNSTLSIKRIDPNSGLITGSYASPSGTPGQAFPLTGWVNTAPATTKGDHVVVVSFSVRWGKIGSVTAWNGFYRLQSNTPTIIGQWHLARPNTDFPWDHILTGQDRFTK